VIKPRNPLTLLLALSFKHTHTRPHFMPQNISPNFIVPFYLIFLSLSHSDSEREIECAIACCHEVSECYLITFSPHIPKARWQNHTVGSKFSSSTNFISRALRCVYVNMLYLPLSFSSSCITTREIYSKCAEIERARARARMR
jgi:hypothetical protein